MKPQTLIFLIAAGLLLALLAGVLTYDLHQDHAGVAVRAVLQEFTEALAAGNLSKARSMLTRAERPMLRRPQNALGEAVYRELKLLRVERVIEDDEVTRVADVTLQTLDTARVIRLADQKLRSESEQMERIYEEILSGGSLPVKETFVIVTLRLEDGEFRICPDEALIRVLEGDLDESLTSR